MRPTLSFGLALLLTAAGCAKNTEPPRSADDAIQPQSTTTTTTAVRTTAPMANPTEPTPGELAMSKPESGMGDRGPMDERAAKTAAPLSDGEVLGVLVAANDGEVQMAEVAIRRAHADDVKSFAAMMKEHHSEGLIKTKSIATKTKIVPAESDVSTHLKSEVADIVKDLKTKKDSREFDAAYMDAQVKAHKEVLQTIMDRLTPSAQNGQVASLVFDTKRIVESHLNRAIDIDKKAGSGISLRSAPATQLRASR